MFNATFRLDGAHTLVIGENSQFRVYDAPRPLHGPRYIPMAIVHHPMQVEQGGLEPSKPEPDRIVAQASLPPSQLRAIASAMLSAATEARA